MSRAHELFYQPLACNYRLVVTVIGGPGKTTPAHRAPSGLSISTSNTMVRSTVRRLFAAWLSLAAAATTLGYESEADAANIIKRPGQHPQYDFELEAHGIYDWAWPATGPGLGVRANIPLFHNGPIDTINNNMAIGFGVDMSWWSYGHRVRRFGRRCWDDWDGRCSGTTLWIPVVLQWNFYLTEIISVFGEPGAAIRYVSWYDDSHFHPFVPVFGGGARFQFGDRVGLTVRIGYPYASVGANILF